MVCTGLCRGVKTLRLLEFLGGVRVESSTDSELKMRLTCSYGPENHTPHAPISIELRVCLQLDAHSGAIISAKASIQFYEPLISSTSQADCAELTVCLHNPFHLTTKYMMRQSSQRSFQRILTCSLDALNQVCPLTSGGSSSDFEGTIPVDHLVMQASAGSW